MVNILNRYFYFDGINHVQCAIFNGAKSSIGDNLQLAVDQAMKILCALLIDTYTHTHTYIYIYIQAWIYFFLLWLSK